MTFRFELPTNVLCHMEYGDQTIDEVGRPVFLARACSRERWRSESPPKTLLLTEWDWRYGRLVTVAWATADDERPF